ncbi:MAG: tetratricopeptide repeat protein [Flavobacteriales bacterium]
MKSFFSLAFLCASLGWPIAAYSQSLEAIAAMYENGEYTRIVAEVAHTESAEIARLRADALQKLGQFTAAMEAYNTAIQMNPADGEAHLNRGICAMSLNNYAGAKVDLATARRIHPSNPKTWYWSAALAYAEGENEPCLNHLAEAVKLKPDYLEAHYLGGALFYDLGALKDAEKAFARCLEINPDHALSQLSLAMVFTEQLRYSKANAILDALADSADDTVRTHALYQRGVSKYESRDREGACADWETAASLGDADAQNLVDTACADAKKKKLERRSVHVEF